jgi:hypothetical protein
MAPPRYTLPCRPSSAGPSLYRSWTEPFTFPRDPSSMPETNASMFNGAYLDNAFPGTGSQSDASFVGFIYYSLPYTFSTYDNFFEDFGSMFGSLPGGGSPQEMFILPLENATSMDSRHPPHHWHPLVSQVLATEKAERRDARPPKPQDSVSLSQPTPTHSTCAPIQSPLPHMDAVEQHHSRSRS